MSFVSIYYRIQRLELGGFVISQITGHMFLKRNAS